MVFCEVSFHFTLSFLNNTFNSFENFQKNQIDRISWLADGDEDGCHCSKSPPHCDCFAKFKIFQHSVEGNIV